MGEGFPFISYELSGKFKDGSERSQTSSWRELLVQTELRHCLTSLILQIFCCVFKGQFGLLDFPLCWQVLVHLLGANHGRGSQVQQFRRMSLFRRKNNWSSYCVQNSNYYAILLNIQEWSFSFLFKSFWEKKKVWGLYLIPGAAQASVPDWPKCQIYDILRVKST